MNVMVVYTEGGTRYNVELDGLPAVGDTFIDHQDRERIVTRSNEAVGARSAGIMVTLPEGLEG